MLKILTQLLEAGTITQEVADKIDGDITPEFSKLRDESAGWRVKYQDINKNFETISKTKDELEGKLSDFDEKILKAKEEGKSELVNELETQRAETQSLQASLESIQKENRVLKIETALNSAIGKYDVIDSELVNSFVKGKVELDGDSLKFKDGENSLTIVDGLKQFFDSKPHLLKPQGNSGSGANGGGSNGGNKPFKEMNATERAELYTKDPALYNKLKG